MARLGLFEWLFLLSVVLVQIQAISHIESNVHNTITEEERRGADNANVNDNAKKNKMIIDNTTNDKQTRGIGSGHSPSASFKHQQYFVPSAYDSHIAATGHGGGAFVGPTSGYDYTGHGGTAPTSAGPAGQGHGHAGYAQHNGPTGAATAFGGYGLAHGYGHGGGHGGQGGFGGLGGLGGHGPHGQSAHGHGHELYGGGGHGGFHSALALKGLLIPLAGIALLGAAAALSTNPVLLQLGVVNGRRRRRSIRNKEAPLVLGKHYPQNPHVQPDSNY